MIGDRRREREDAFTEFFRAESGTLARLGTFLTGDPERGADLAQEALARTYRHWGRIYEEPGSYTRRILVNLVRSEHRRAVVRRRHPERPPEPVSSRDVHVNDWIVLSGALAKLSPVRRATVVLRFYEDLPEKEIARVLDRPLGSVKSDLHRALRQLREELTEKQPNATTDHDIGRFIRHPLGRTPIEEEPCTN